MFSMTYQADPGKVTDYKRKYIRRAQCIMVLVQVILGFGIYLNYHPLRRYNRSNTPADPVIAGLLTVLYLWLIYKMFLKLIKDSALLINQSIEFIEFNSSVIRFSTMDCSMFGGIISRSVYWGEMSAGEFKASLFVSKSESQLARDGRVIRINYAGDNYRIVENLFPGFDAVLDAFPGLRFSNDPIILPPDNRK